MSDILAMCGIHLKDGTGFAMLLLSKQLINLSRILVHKSCINKVKIKIYLQGNYDGVPVL